MNESRLRRKRQVEKQRKILALAGLIFVCFFLVFGGLTFRFYKELKKTKTSHIYKGVHVGRTDVSGLDKSEAIAKVTAQMEAEKAGVLTFQSGEKSAQATYGELGVSAKGIDKAVEKAVDYGKKGGIWGRYFQVRKLKKEPKVFRITYQIDEEQTRAILSERVLALLDHATDAVIRRENGAFVIDPEQEGVTLDVEGMLKETSAFLNEKWDGKDGSVEVLSTKHEPTVKAADLEGIQDLLGTFQTYCGSGQSRVTNIEVGTGKINGSVVMPGEEFCAGDAMRPLTLENGYVEAGAYENGKVVQDIAGGICQVSTTLYNAVINAELEITSRQPHSMVVAYVKPSRDAAIAGDYKDLKFKNNLDTAIYIEGYVSDGNVTFNIYGKETRDPGREIEFISETLETTEAPTEYKTSEELPLGEKNTTGNPHDGVKAKLWKVVKQDGEEVSREHFNSSTYQSSPRIIEVGIKTDNAQAASIVRNAVATKDGAKIDAAIAEARALVSGGDGQ